MVEILSPSSAIYDRNTKADTYAALGVRELWLADLERRAIEVRVPEGGRWTKRATLADDARVESAVFPGLSVVVNEVFAAP